MDKTGRKLRLPYFELNKPFKEIDISEHDVLEIVGFEFPISSKGKIEIKEQRKLKEPLKIESMITKLELKHQIVFSPKEKIEANEFFKYTNYYRISIFIRYLNKDRSFTALKNIYEFDNFLSENIGNMIPPLEGYIGTSLAYVLTNEYEDIIKRLDKKGENLTPALVYLDKRIYRDEFIRNNSIDNTFSYIAKSLFDKQDRDLTIKHHVSFYDGWVPFWVLVEHITFGDLSTILRYLERNVKKTWIDYSFPNNNPSTIIEWLNTIRILRNTAAHCSRFYGSNFTYNPKINKEDLDLMYFEKEDERYRTTFKNTLFAGLIVLRRLYESLREADKIRWNNFIYEIELRLAKDENLSKSRLGFNNQWSETLKIVI
ncbi:Abi family protein [Listeria weihenstephanensis]|uniref:Abi family protein n=1 Tax=Listeria weihenstephanensis TaxID=1006155 RepID=A0A841Z4V1_9LIST|nr:Abi family protein [Listeria weihenstephanensis]MBC1499423.1 Abi family protein [Listeria weihenstephanensis]